MVLGVRPSRLPLSHQGGGYVKAKDRIASIRGAPRTIRVDNGPEFISKALDRWTSRGSRPGKPTDNAFVESFNGRFRDECLNTHWFFSGRCQEQDRRVETGL